MGVRVSKLPTLMLPINCVLFNKEALYVSLPDRGKVHIAATFIISFSINSFYINGLHMGQGWGQYSGIGVSDINPPSF
jgi:hypothetical protein